MIDFQIFLILDQNHDKKVTSIEAATLPQRVRVGDVVNNNNIIIRKNIYIATL